MDAGTTSETTLLTNIKTAWGAAIAEACNTSSVPETFLAALIANESGGRNDARRFEPHVLLSLWEVLLGRKANYGSIARAVVVGYVTRFPVTPTTAPTTLQPDVFQRLDWLATSWGLTQIMGWHVLGTSHDVEDLRLPEVHLGMALQMLAAFAQEFSLDVTKDFEEMFRCWNTGRPDGQTFDPAYVNNGLARMAIWTSL